MVPGIDRAKFLKFVEVLYLPWIRMVGDSNKVNDVKDEGVNVVDEKIDDSPDDDSETAVSSVFKFIRAVWFPWVGILSGK
mmetsp:Transcript_15646/g.39023  ORF Transcript_15646/g.39023 Transcript_15646/m.39023 type:complete len:80 (+) Transcript_15646:94-333(+)